MVQVIGENLLGPEPTRLSPEPAIETALATQPVAAVVQANPESSLAWALLADAAYREGNEVEAYAYARVGYHRGLDALRRAGWRGQGPIPWSHEPNRGVLRALFALRRSAAQIGEEAEVVRLTEFLNGADPDVIATLEGGA